MAATISSGKLNHEWLAKKVANFDKPMYEQFFGNEIGLDRLPMQRQEPSTPFIPSFGMNGTSQRRTRLPEQGKGSVQVDSGVAEVQSFVDPTHPNGTDEWGTRRASIVLDPTHSKFRNERGAGYCFFQKPAVITNKKRDFR